MEKIIIASVLMICGCSTANWASSVSSGAIGCPSKDIKIYDYTTHNMVVGEWVAECKGKKYICNYTQGNTNCSESK